MLLDAQLLWLVAGWHTLCWSKTCQSSAMWFSSCSFLLAWIGLATSPDLKALKCLSIKHLLDIYQCFHWINFLLSSKIWWFLHYQIVLKVIAMIVSTRGFAVLKFGWTCSHFMSQMLDTSKLLSLRFDSQTELTLS